MAAVRGIKKLLKSDLQDSPDWFDPVITVLNEFLDTVISALRKKLTFSDNFLAEYKEFTFTHGVELEIATTLSSYGGVLIVKPPNTADADQMIAAWGARQVKTKTIGVTINFVGAGTTSGKVGLYILG
jgi:hypothetical protein